MMQDRTHQEAAIAAQASSEAKLRQALIDDHSEAGQPRMRRLDQSAIEIRAREEDTHARAGIQPISGLDLDPAALTKRPEPDHPPGLHFIDHPSHRLTYGVKMRAQLAYKADPSLHFCLLTPQGEAFMATDAQFAESFALRKEPEFCRHSNAEVIAALYPKQALSLLVTEVGEPTEEPGWDRNTWNGKREEVSAARALDRQVGGEHYRKMKIQPVDFILANNLDFLEGNAIKYICRHATKGGEQDIDKAIHYLQILKEKYYGAPK